MKKTLLFTVFAFISIACFSQDLISLKRGAKIQAIVTEITPTLVRYKLFSDPNGREYFTYKDDIADITHKDGRKETFDQSDDKTAESKSNLDESQNQNQNQNQNLNQNQDQSQNQKLSRKQNHYQTQQPKPVARNQDSDNETQPQAKSRSSFSQFHVGIAAPSGNFADGVAMGFTAGYKYYGSLSAENLSWVFGIGAFYNAVSASAKKALDSQFQAQYPDCKITYPMFFNFPATIGLNYAIPLQETTKVYGEAAVGGNFSMPTKIQVSYGGASATNATTPAFGFAFGVEVGVFINNKYSIGVRYNDLGSYKYKHKVTGGADYTDDEALAISDLSICLGVLF